MIKFARRARKFLVAAVGALAVIVAAGILPEPAKSWAVAALAVATALGVYRVPNAPAPRAIPLRRQGPR